MLDVHAPATPNSVKVPIAAEKLDLAYALRGVSVREGARRAPALLALNSNGEVPIQRAIERASVPVPAA